MEIPQGVTIRVDGNRLIAKGSAGEVQKMLPPQAKISVNGSSVEVTTADRALKGTLESMVKNMMHGVAKGYSKSFKLIYAHFPITVDVKGNDVAIKNFLGEKEPRRTVLVGSTKVQAKGQSVTISGPDKEAVGQTIANMRIAMRIKEKDGRVFQDGMYDVEAEG